jgi:acetyl-CoA carboxylase carboxyltransferase component
VDVEEGACAPTRSRYENRLPSIGLTESGGADLPTQKEIFIPGGRIFRDLTRAVRGRHPDHRAGLRQLDRRRRVHPGMSDYVVMVKERAKVFLGRPAAGEDGHRRGERRRVARRRRDARPDQRPGRLLAVDEMDALRIGREIVSPAQLAQARPGPKPAGRSRRATTRRNCSASSRRPQGALRPARGHRPDRRRLDFDEFKPLLRLVAGHRLGPLHGYPIGILANARGVLFSEEAQKAAQFIQLANQSRHAAGLPAEHHRLHGRQGVRAGRHHQARRPDDQRGVELDACRTSP